MKSKALRYHQALQRRPASGFLFDRFVDGWLEFSTLADLEQFLQQQVEANKKTNDQVLLALFYAKQVIATSDPTKPYATLKRLNDITRE